MLTQVIERFLFSIVDLKCLEINSWLVSSHCKQLKYSCLTYELVNRLQNQCSLGILCACLYFFPVRDITSVGLFVVAMDRLTFNIVVWMTGSVKGDTNA